MMNLYWGGIPEIYSRCAAVTEGNYIVLDNCVESHAFLWAPCGEVQSKHDDLEGKMPSKVRMAQQTISTRKCRALSNHQLPAI